MPNDSRYSKTKTTSDLTHIKTSGEYPYEERDKINPQVRPGSARTRGFRGNKYGPASPVRQFTKEEIAGYERKARDDGKM
ncbi:MAG: hypothetical protein ACD_23C01223G0003 [uncultured bacterium]|jgi:hypothetical protein|nr:MAG: hypothetical protein ACD_23C01223G0003 [uncultured bacterium]